MVHFVSVLPTAVFWVICKGLVLADLDTITTAGLRLTRLCYCIKLADLVLLDSEGQSNATERGPE